jgi:sulfite reductase subunit B
MTTKEQIIKKSPFKPEYKKIIYYKRETSNSFTIRLDWKLKHGVGQFIFCSLPGIGEAPISICSYNSDYVELNIMEVGNVTKNLAKIKKGDKLLVRGSYGTHYPMKDLVGNNLIIVGGGCGVAPLKGVIEYVLENRSDYKDVDLYLGYRSPSNTLFEEHINNWKEQLNVNISFDKFPDEEKSLPICSLGNEGFITNLVKEKVVDNNHKVVFLCGPPIMIEKTIEILMNKGFNPDQIFFSAERLMYCGIGKCGRCMIHGHYTCLDGSVFRYDQLKEFKDD